MSAEPIELDDTPPVTRSSRRSSGLQRQKKAQKQLDSISKLLATPRPKDKDEESSDYGSAKDDDDSQGHGSDSIAGSQVSEEVLYVP